MPNKIDVPFGRSVALGIYRDIVAKLSKKGIQVFQHDGFTQGILSAVAVCEDHVKEVREFIASYPFPKDE